jgi:hypothetical protein
MIIELVSLEVKTMWGGVRQQGQLGVDRSGVEEPKAARRTLGRRVEWARWVWAPTEARNGGG